MSKMSSEGRIFLDTSALRIFYRSIVKSVSRGGASSFYYGTTPRARSVNSETRSLSGGCSVSRERECAPRLNQIQD